MKTNPIPQDSGWHVSFWFAVSSPLIGVLLGLPLRGDFLSLTEQAMSITPIIFALVILLFGFDSTVQVESPPATRSRLTRSVRAERFAQEICDFLKSRFSDA